MKARSEERLERLFAAAREERIDTTGLEEHFETRLLARIRERRSRSLPWYALAWRMVPFCALLAGLITIASLSLAPPAPGDMFAALTGDQDEIDGSGYLMGE